MKQAAIITGQQLKKGAIWTASATKTGVKKLDEAVEANPKLKDAKDKTVKSFK